MGCGAARDPSPWGQAASLEKAEQPSLQSVSVVELAMQSKGWGDTEHMDAHGQDQQAMNRHSGRWSVCSQAWVLCAHIWKWDQVTGSCELAVWHPWAGLPLFSPV